MTEASTTTLPAPPPEPERVDVEQLAKRHDIPRRVLASTLAHAGWPLIPTPGGLSRLVTEAAFLEAVAAARKLSIR